MAMRKRHTEAEPDVYLGEGYSCESKKARQDLYFDEGQMHSHDEGRKPASKQDIDVEAYTSDESLNILDMSPDSESDVTHELESPHKPKVIQVDSSDDDGSRSVEILSEVEASSDKEDTLHGGNMSKLVAGAQGTCANAGIGTIRKSAFITGPHEIAPSISNQKASLPSEGPSSIAVSVIEKRRFSDVSGQSQGLSMVGSLEREAHPPILPAFPSANLVESSEPENMTAEEAARKEVEDAIMNLLKSERESGNYSEYESSGQQFPSADYTTGTPCFSADVLFP